jgi:glycyl-tRNA synthetase beta chain
VDRELLIEIGCEELPAGWLPSVTGQLGEHVGARLNEKRLAPEAPIETFSTPRRLTVRIARVAERQTDLEELVTGPRVAAAFGADGEPTPAAIGFARKQGVEVPALERVQTPRGEYLAYRRHQRGKAAVDVLPDVFGAVLRDLAFPKQMHWDAWLDDGRGELLFGRPIRWILFLYGGRVVPFVIKRTELAQTGQVQDVRSGAVTYGHRFLATTGRAGRAIKVRSFDEYHARLLENFVVLDRGERHDKIARELDAHARRLGGRVSAAAVHSGLLQEVPDLVEYPSVVAGTFAPEFLELPDEVLTTTMIHHQHDFPVVNETGRLMPAFLSVVNTQPDNQRTIARNAERVLAARLRDARFFYDADRRARLAVREAELDGILFHKRLGTYRQKAERLERLAGWVAGDLFGDATSASHAARAGRLAKADLATGMVRELTELQGTMGGIYAREEGLPEQVWKAIYYQYLPVGVEADAPPTRGDLGNAAVSWAAVSLADKLDTLAGLFASGERPTGSRDPFGLRRQAHGVLKILADLPEVTGLDLEVTLGQLVRRAREVGGYQLDAPSSAAFYQFLLDRLRYLFEQRGHEYGEVRAVTHHAQIDRISPLGARRRLEALSDAGRSAELQALAVLFKRVKNIARELADAEYEQAEREDPPLRGLLGEPAELALVEESDRLRPVIEQAAQRHSYLEAFGQAARLGPLVDRFFAEVFVMVDDPALRKARLRLMKRLQNQVLELADISEIAPRAEP